MDKPIDQPITANPNAIPMTGPIVELREREIQLLQNVAEHVGKNGADGAADRQRLMDAANDLREMFFMVVIIGEFNAGKSTFVNALLGDTLLPMGITPTTNVIELVRYKPVATQIPQMSGESIREWGHPNTTNQGVVIVDTPGTGSVFQEHEQIAKSFLHRSDLVIFVISAKRAFAETERLYLELAKSYGKKIIVVINQIDLLEPKEREDVLKFVDQQLGEMLGIHPRIFPVSAKRDLFGDKPGGLRSVFSMSKSDSGMDDVRAYLREMFDQVSPAKQKLLTELALLRSTTTRYRDAIQSKLSLIGSDTNAAEDLQNEIERQASNLDQQQASTLKELHSIFEGVQRRGEKFVDKHIRVVRASVRGIDKDTLQKEFETDVIGDALTKISSTQEHYANALVDNGRAYWRGIVVRLNKMEALLREEETSMDAAAYADQRAALQAAMSMADVEMKAYADNHVIEAIQANFAQNTRTFTYSAIGGIVGIVAALLSAATPSAIGGVAGVFAAHLTLAMVGIIAGPVIGVVGGGAAIVIWRRAVSDAHKQLKAKIDELENSYKQSIVKLTTDERNRLIQYGKQILSPVFSQLQTLAQRYKDQQGQVQVFNDRAMGLESEINALDKAAKPSR